MSDISREDAIREARPEYLNPQQEKLASYNQGWNDAIDEYMSGIKALPSASRPTGRWMSFEEVAEMLSGMFDECACNVNGNDEWLPESCKYADTECPNPKEKNGCWMQFLIQGGADMREREGE